MLKKENYLELTASFYDGVLRSVDSDNECQMLDAVIEMRRTVEINSDIVFNKDIQAEDIVSFWLENQRTQNKVNHEIPPLMSGKEITFITDVRNNEGNFLPAICKDHLRIIDLNDVAITTVYAPHEGWTHDLLMEQARMLAVRTMFGANAYLGGTWVGSTEV